MNKMVNVSLVNIQNFGILMLKNAVVVRRLIFIMLIGLNVFVQLNYRIIQVRSVLDVMHLAIGNLMLAGACNVLIIRSMIRLKPFVPTVRNPLLFLIIMSVIHAQQIHIMIVQEEAV